ncbi:hypothetical protein AAMO2058_000775700 [Amorphochlora amoebiformis]
MLPRRGRTIVEWSPHMPERFALASTSIQLYDLTIPKNASSTGDKQLGMPKGTPRTLVDTITVKEQVRCLEWSPDATQPELFAVATVDSLSLLRFQYGKRVLVDMAPRFRATCNALAWNHFDPSKLAIGLHKTRSFSTLVFDISRETTAAESTISPHPKPIKSPPLDPAGEAGGGEGGGGWGRPFRQISLTEPTGALKWFPGERHVLGVGTFKWLRVYDIRTELKKKPRTVLAHNRIITGLEFDPTSPWRMATHTRGDVIKIWDTRLLRSHITKIHVEGSPLCIRWAPFRKGLLAAALEGQSEISFYEISSPTTSVAPHPKHPATPHPLPHPPLLHPPPFLAPQGAVKAKTGGVESFSWHPTRPHYIMLATSEEVEARSVHHYLPLALSTTNEIVFGSFSTVSIFSPGNSTGAMDSTGLPPIPGEAADISEIIRYRALRGYGLDLMANYWIAVELRHPNLIKLWSWLLDLQPSNSNTAAGEAKVSPISKKTPGISKKSPGISKADSTGESIGIIGANSLTRQKEGLPNLQPLPYEGALALIQGQEKQSTHRTAPDPSEDRGGWFVAHYVSKERERALRLCGWCPLEERAAIETLLRRLQQRSLFQRAAALALFHLDVNRAIRALVEGSKALSQGFNSSRIMHMPTDEGDVKARWGESKREEEQAGGRADDLRMAAIAISGYGTANKLWRATCQLLLRQLKSPYLRAALTFLSSDGSAQGLADVLQQYDMDLRDRVGFALRFLPDAQLVGYLNTCLKNSVRDGLLEGILITGVSARNQGTCALLQAYVDRTTDIQTAALVACYAGAGLPTPPPVPGEGVTQQGSIPQVSTLNLDAKSAEKKTPIQTFRVWMHNYRSLLDSWRLWMQRARLDVSRALLSRAAQTLSTSGRYPPGVGEQGKGGGRLGGIGKRNTIKQPPLAPLAQQVYLRCKACSQPLSAPRMPLPTFRTRRGIFRGRGGTGPGGGGQTGGMAGGVGAARSSECPSCKLPLPRCALCLETMDIATPYAIAARRAADVKDGKGSAKKRVGGPRKGKTKGIDGDSAHPFGEWFVWCQECRHGGHAGHMHDWFANHFVCPVAKCDCRCMQLDEPALRVRDAGDGYVVPA